MLVYFGIDPISFDERKNFNKFRLSLLLNFNYAQDARIGCYSRNMFQSCRVLQSALLHSPRCGETASSEVGITIWQQC